MRKSLSQQLQAQASIEHVFLTCDCGKETALPRPQQQSELFDFAMEQVVDELSGAEAMTLCFDTWRDKNLRYFMGVAASALASDWKLVQHTIGLVAAPDGHFNLSIAATVQCAS